MSLVALITVVISGIFGLINVLVPMAFDVYINILVNVIMIVFAISVYSLKDKFGGIGAGYSILRIIGSLSSITVMGLVIAEVSLGMIHNVLPGISIIGKILGTVIFWKAYQTL